MTKSPWQQRIRRAEHLAAQHPFAAEILGFYVAVARFQEDLYRRLERDGDNQDVSAGAANPMLLDSFPQFLAVVEKKGPAPLAQIARDKADSNFSSWSDLLTKCWADVNSPTDPIEFLVVTFLQPYAEFVRSRSGLQAAGYTQSLCPFCSRKPALGILRPQGDGGRRSLLCGFCMMEWEFRRVVCPGCGQEDHAKLPVYTAETFPYIRVECCDTCQTYIKTIDLTRNGLAEPLVDELAAVPLNLWAQERGYDKLRRNMLGM